MEKEKYKEINSSQPQVTEMPSLSVSVWLGSEGTAQ